VGIGAAFVLVYPVTLAEVGFCSENPAGVGTDRQRLCELIGRGPGTGDTGGSVTYGLLPVIVYVVVGLVALRLRNRRWLIAAAVLSPCVAVGQIALFNLLPG
jgi:hypothetical protein